MTDTSIFKIKSINKNEENKLNNTKIQIKSKRRNRKYKLNINNAMIISDLDPIILSEENLIKQSKKLKNNYYQSIMKTHIKAKLKIKLEPCFKTTNKKLRAYKNYNKSCNHENKNFLQVANNNFNNGNLKKLVNIDIDKVTDTLFNNKSYIRNKNDSDSVLKNIENEKLTNMEIIQNSILPLKNNKEIIQSQIKLKSKKHNKQLAIKKCRNIFIANEFNITDNDDICKICKQKLDNQLKFYSGEPQHGYEEELANIDSRLLLINGDVENISKHESKVYNKLTYFSIYCKNGHLCPFDSELIENNVEIYFSGYVKSIQSINPSIENGVPGKNFGPIIHWSVTFDDEEQPIINVSTEIGVYILMKPSEEYASLMKSFITNMIISKIVIEYLVYEPNTTYEDLLNKIQNTPTLNNSLSVFTEDKLMHHAPFICNQVMLFDEKAKPWEQLLVVSPCIRRLLALTGITILDNVQSRQQSYWKHMEENYREKLMYKVFKETRDYLAMQKLIDRLLPVNGNVLMTSVTKQRWSRCGFCKFCQLPGCEACTACSKKNYSLCSQRRCSYRQIQDANEKDAEDNEDESQMEIETSINVYKNNIKKFSCFFNKQSWLGKPIVEESGNIYFNAIKLDDEVIGMNDFVFVCSVDSSMPAQIVKIAYMWEDEAGVARFHANYFWSHRDTVLGNFADPKELFFIEKCCNMIMSCAMKKAQVFKQILPKNLDELDSNKFRDVIPKNSFFYQKCYDPVTGSFRDLQFNKEISQATAKFPHQFCCNCELVRLRNERNTPRPFELIKKNDIKVTYGALMYRDEEYRFGSCVYLRPKSLYYKYPMPNNNAKLYSHVIQNINEEKYPEYYSKLENSETSSEPHHVPATFDIGYITDIFTVNDKLFIKVKKLYRPENTHKGEVLNQYDINMLFWSNEECEIPFNYVVNKCYVTCAKNLKINLYEWLNMGPDRFYFTHMYEDNKFSKIDTNMHSCEIVILEKPKNYPNIKKLKTLDIFAGCGGFSLGLSQAGVAKICWAIESNPFAAKTYKLNNPDATVFVEDANNILKLIMKGAACLNNQCLPRKQEVELLCATLPCKNFKYSNNISSFKNSYIATFILYCEYYKPSLFVLETDETLIKKSVILKLTLASLIGMGYQVAFGLLQVGCYGAPQNRKRSVLLGAAPGQILPKYPKYLHVFPKLYCQSEIIIDKRKYTRENNWIKSAPYRVVTVRDAIWDLPNIKAGEIKQVINYYGKPTNYFQKMMRLNMLEPILFDHMCKDLGPVVQARLMYVPRAIGSDWRNLPNIEIQFKDGSFLKKLVYGNGTQIVKESRDVRRSCSCSVGKKCNLIKNRQEDSLIPWYLVHSGPQHDNWPGLYGRLHWDGFFAGTITNPEPLSAQGPVIHPTQPRVVSVRECARSQGFPDDFVFPEETSIQDKYRQIGCAISPLLALAIGREIAWSLD